MNDPRRAALQFAREEKENYLQQLIEFVKFPSVSTDNHQKAVLSDTAVWIAKKLEAIGIQNVQLLPNSGPPVVYGEHAAAAPGAPTVLIYGHYDVQPAEPLHLWESDPFNPVVRGENLYGRGTSDMKGEVMATIYAVEAVLKHGGLPVNVKFLLEGEEEIGSPNLAPLLEEKKDLFFCDVALNTDAGMLAKDAPSITYGLRGLAYFELRVEGPRQDLHSGLFGGVVHNPAQALCELIAAMHDSHGRVTLPGFYDQVIPLQPEERAELARLPVNDASYLQQTGAPALWGESGFLPIERIGARPTLEVNGLYSGFTESGSKTIIPAWAMAKISMRLVPAQDPAQVHRQLSEFLEQRAPNTIRWELTQMVGGVAALTNLNHPACQAYSDAVEQVWSVRPFFTRSGGSVPVVADLQHILGVESVMTGFSLPEDNVHGPNEKLHLPTWYKGIETLIHFLYNYGGAAN
ncbi:MAG: dipeptidase [Anaerolineaceae bacterium]|nr:dipeptidase [Anaerolineaceae bacterium]